MTPISPDPLDQRLTALLIQNARESVANLARQLGTAAGATELQAYVGICVAPMRAATSSGIQGRRGEVRNLACEAQGI